MKSLEVHGSQVIESPPFVVSKWEFLSPDLVGHTHLGKMPWDAFVLFFGLFDPALKPTVGEGVALIELQVHVVVEKTPTGLWQDVLDPISGDNCGRKLDEVLPSWLKSDALVPHHRKLSWLTNEQVGNAVMLVKAAKGDRVGVEVEGELQPVPAPLLRHHLQRPLVPLQLLDQLLIFRCFECVVAVESAAHARVSGDPGEEV